MQSVQNSTDSLTLLSELLLGTEQKESSEHINSEHINDILAAFKITDFDELWRLATSHHVILRAFAGLSQATAVEKKNSVGWVNDAVRDEQARIHNALTSLSPICQAIESVGDVIVIKSLDHWPDLGNDLDLYTNAQSDDVVAVMMKKFGARLAQRSWGDRLANKWNFMVPGLPELIEVHVGRLGQTGEQVAITNSLVTRSRIMQFGPYAFRVPAPEDRLMISTLQRMYRHFYLRLCDVADNALLVDSRTIDYDYLESLARSAGLWDGLATYLVVVSEYVKPYRGTGLALPVSVRQASRPGDNRLSFRKGFLRIPLVPHAAGFYASEWKNLLRNGEVRNTLRLSLLPGLAVAATVGLKLTGSDKGIW